MVFSSAEFIWFFLPIVLVIYFGVGVFERNGNVVKKKYFIGVKLNMNSNLNLKTKDTKPDYTKPDYNNNKALDYFNSLPDAEVKDDNQEVYSNKFNLFEYV